MRFVHLFKQYNVNVFKFIKSKLTIKNIIKYLGLLVIIPVALYYLSFSLS